MKAKYIKEVMTREEALEHYRAWLAADAAIARNKSYTVDGLTVTRQDAETIRKQIAYWEKILAAFDGETPSDVRVRFALPIDEWHYDPQRWPK